MQLHKIVHVARKCNNSPFICIREFHQSPCLEIRRLNEKSKFRVGGSGGETMEAIVFNSLDKSVKLLTKQAKPHVTGPDDVLIKVAYAGICGTDLHIIKGEFPVKEDGPVILGHEFSGVVEDVGTQCTMFQKGQNVVVDPNSLCCLCKPCRLGRYQYCSTKSAIGLFRDGGWAQYCVVPQHQVFALPEDVTLEQGALCEPYSCVWHGMDKLAPINVGETILILGAGIIGSMVVSVLHLQGHKKVTVTEVNESRLAIIKNLETSYRLTTPSCLHKEKPIFDVIIDCTGVGPVMDKAFTYLDDGGKYLVFGCAPPTHNSTISPFEVFNKELSILGTKVNPFGFPHALGYLSAMGDRYLNYQKLGIETFPLSDLPSAIEKLEKGLIAKAVLIPNMGSNNSKC